MVYHRAPVNTVRVDGAGAFPPAREGSLVAIGNFDGVHTGHRAVLESAIQEARTRRLAPVVLTFDPHPSVVLGRAPRPVLTTLERKLELIGRIGELTVVVEPFTRELAALTPEQFARDLLADALRAHVVLVGRNFRFGRGRAGDLDVLSTLGAQLGFEARSEELVSHDDEAVSSTRIRSLVAAGDVVGACRLLDRPHAVTGTVVEGDRRGRTLGFPTANLADVQEALPANGVYACVVDVVEDGVARKLGRAAVNLGARPTVGGGFSVEAHVLEHASDLYGQRLRLHFVERLRNERRFDGLPALKAQIASDVEAAGAVLGACAGDARAEPAWF